MSVLQTLWSVCVSSCIATIALQTPAFSAPDVLVVCPAEFRPALREWETYRRAQGHDISVIGRPATADQLRATVRSICRAGETKYLLIVGDVPEVAQTGHAPATSSAIGPDSLTTVPTNYVAGKVNIRWGSEPEIASDAPYADLDGDGVPDLAIGRIPVHSADELAGVIRKEIRYEQSNHGPWEKCLNIVSGAGGFGAVTDALVEAAGRQVVQQTVPLDYDVRRIVAIPATAGAPEELDFGLRARNQLNDGGLAWIYLGHGLPWELDRAPSPNGRRSILSTRDVPGLRCGPHNPLAVLIACYAGAMDARQNCLAEDLLNAEQGPVAVIAATRVTMPYGNTVMGYELLRACFRDQPAKMGDIVRLAEQRVLVPTANDPMRQFLDSVAAGLSPSPIDLAAERREHVLMYHLIGDPLLRLHRAATRVAQVTGAAAVTK